jgi:hypothetical protein
MDGVEPVHAFRTSIHERDAGHIGADNEPRHPYDSKAFQLPPVSIMAEVAVVIAIPAMVVHDSSVVAIPVAFKKHSTFISRPDPVRACVWWPRPVPFMPLVTITFWIPIAVYPEIIWTRGGCSNPLHTG